MGATRGHACLHHATRERVQDGLQCVGATAYDGKCVAKRECAAEREHTAKRERAAKCERAAKREHTAA
jgi:hypothetical protein